MSYIGTAMREAWRGIFHGFGSFIGSVLTVFLAMLVAGSFALIIKNTGGALDQLKGEAMVEVYIKDDVDSSGVEALKDRLVANKDILQLKYISKESALYRLRQTFGPEMVAGLESNPLPRSFEITLDPGVYDKQNFEALIDTLYTLPGVEDIGYVPTVIARLKTIFKLVTALGILMGLLVAVATGYIVGNTIHVKIADRRQTFYIMRLVGGSNRFIRLPYLFIGSLIGGLAGILAIFFLKLGQLYFTTFVVSVDFLNNIETICFIVTGILLGFIGGHLALKRFLRI